MAPLIMGLIQAAPMLAKWISGDDKDKPIVDRAIELAETLTGQKGGSAIQAINSDAAIAVEFQHRIASRELEFNHLVSMRQLDIESSRIGASTVIAEAGGESDLQRNWRPIVMLWFAALVGAHWLGLTPDTLKNDQVLALLEIVKLGLAGYVVGRSAEKVMKEYKR